VRATLALQAVLFSLAAYECVQVLALSSQYAALGMNVQLGIRVFLPAVLMATSLIGLWNNRRWGWILALVADGALCVQDLWSLLDYPIVASPRTGAWIFFNVWDFIAFALLLFQPVRSHFLRRETTVSTATLSPRRVQDRLELTVGPVRVLIYFTVAVVATCVVTAFSVTVFIGQKSGGGRGFLVLLLFAFLNGSAASLIFAVILTLTARKLGPSRLSLWLMLGGSLAPAITIALGMLGWIFMLASMHGTNSVSPFFGYIAFAPAVLIQVGWLLPPIGVFTAWVCYSMYPWAFLQSQRTKLPT